MSRVSTPSRQGAPAAEAKPSAPSEAKPKAPAEAKPGTPGWKTGTPAAPAKPAAPPTYAAKPAVPARAPATASANSLVGTSARMERPVDATSLLRDAKEPGVLFTEDRDREGYREDADDPELAAAVEDVIRLLFGVRGVLRVGPGKDEAGSAVVVITVSAGFAHASLASLPATVRGFATVTAIPFDVLPLKRDR